MATRTFGPDTAEFRFEFARATTTLLRRRLGWFIAIWGGFNLLALPFDVARHFTFRGPLIEGDVERALRDPGWTLLQWAAFVAGHAVWIGGFGAVLALTRRPSMPHARAVTLSIALVVLQGAVIIVHRLAGITPAMGLVFFGLAHLVASMTFPWTPRQAVVPAAIVLVANAASFVLRPGIDAGVAVGLALSPIVVLPGVLVCWLRHTRRLERFGYAFLQNRYGTIRQELAYARAVHESLFPTPRDDGPVRFAYGYEPMRQIGGDFLHVAGTPDALSVILLDVTGHGIPAALTVNRLHGEIELYFADNPAIGPGEVLRRLNRYVALTLARHSLFATALCLRIDTRHGTVEHASGGHPPAFLLGADGTLDELSSTACVLGARPEQDFDPAPQTRAFHPLDALIAYTDGVTEARDPAGRMLRTAGLRELLRRIDAPPGRRARALLDAVTAYRGHRSPEDDTLLVELYRPAAPRPARDDDAAPAPSLAVT